MNNYIKNYWEDLEKKKSPKYFKSIKIIQAKKFFKLINERNKNKSSIQKIINELYQGRPYIIKNAISKKKIEILKQKLILISDTEKSSFFKMNKKCPNFWRRQDESIAKKYSVSAIRDSYYFFRWNKKNRDIWKVFNYMWGSIKLLGGLKKNSYVKNTPKDGVVDRIQIVRYPDKTGYIEPHFHDPKNQRLIISVYMSKRGSDYNGGGTCFYRGKKIVNIEDKIDIGDVGIFYATLKHAVHPVKSSSKKIKQKFRGRWWCGLYSPESDMVKNRHTSSPIN